MYISSVQELYSFKHNHIYSLCENCFIPLYSKLKMETHIAFGMCLKNDASAVEAMPTEEEAFLKFNRLSTILSVHEFFCCDFETAAVKTLPTVSISLKTAISRIVDINFIVQKPMSVASHEPNSYAFCKNLTVLKKGSINPISLSRGNVVCKCSPKRNRYYEFILQRFVLYS